MTLNVKIEVFMDFLAIWDCDTHFKSKSCQNHCR